MKRPRTTKRKLAKRLEKIEPDDSDEPTLVLDLRGTGQVWRDEDGPDDVPDRDFAPKSGGIHVFVEVDK